MELLEAIKGRRSVRKFTDTPVSKDAIEKILEVTTFCPNAGNRNSTRIVVFTDHDSIQYIGKAHGKIIQNFNKGITEPPTESEINETENAFHNAPMVLALFGPQNFYFSAADAYIMAQSITLAAYEQGVSTCIVGEVLNAFATKKGREIQKTAGIPDGFVPQVYITMGYCDGEYPKLPPRHYADVTYL